LGVAIQLDEIDNMKILIFVSVLLLSSLCSAYTQQPAPVKKPPVGVPADAKFFNGKWYYVYFQKTSWPTARQKCTALGGQLVTVPDAETWEFVKALAKGPILWIGATDEVTAGVWKWVDGTPVVFSAWEPGEPDNMGGKQHYVVMTKKALWDDVDKELKPGPYQVVGFICEWKDK
jgi:hypothetical protein